MMNSESSDFLNGDYLVISPHSDDAAFSVGGILNRLSCSRGCRIDLVTAFFPPDQFHGEPPIGVSRDEYRLITAHLREHEDLEFAKSIRAELITLNFVDAVCRDTGSFEDLFGGLTLLDETLIVELAERMGQLAVRRTWDYVLLPMALGAHRDHSITRIAIETAVKESDAFGKLVYYEEFPYNVRQRIRPKPGRRFLAPPSGFEPLTIELDPQESEAKRRSISIYESQASVMWPASKEVTVCSELDELKDLYGTDGWCERVWLHRH